MVDEMKSPIEIDQMIIHRVDHWAASEPICSEAALVIAKDSDVHNYLSRHIRRVLDEEKTRDALFFEDASNSNKAPNSIFYNAMASRDQFVEYSIQIAKKLFANMLKKNPSDPVYDVDEAQVYKIKKGRLIKNLQANENIHPADLVICTYRDHRNGAQPSLHLGIFKMDPQDGFSTTETKVNGKKVLVLEPVSGVLPPIDEELSSGLQKAAIIFPQPSKDRHLKVLDLQMGRRGDLRQVGAASFFRVGFLNCHFCFDPIEIVRNLDRTVENYTKKVARKHEDGKTPVKMLVNATQLREKVHANLKEKTINIPALVESVLTTEDEQNQFNKLWAATGIVDKEFTTDEESRTYGPKPIRFSGDNGLEIKVKRGLAAENAKLGDKVNGDELMLVYRKDKDAWWHIEIRTKKWDQLNY